MHGYAQSDVAPTVRYASLSEISGNLENAVNSLLSRLRRVNGHLNGGGGQDKPDGPKPVPLGMIPSIAEVLANLNRVDEECYKIEMALGIDSPPSSNGLR